MALTLFQRDIQLLTWIKSMSFLATLEFPPVMVGNNHIGKLQANNYISFTSKVSLIERQFIRIKTAINTSSKLQGI